MNRPRDAWFRQPVVWLGALILLASLAGCAVMIMLASRHADAPVEAGGGSVLKVPLRHPSGATPGEAP